MATSEPPRLSMMESLIPGTRIFESRLLLISRYIPTPFRKPYFEIKFSTRLKFMICLSWEQHPFKPIWLLTLRHTVHKISDRLYHSRSVQWPLLKFFPCHIFHNHSSTRSSRPKAAFHFQIFPGF